MVCTWVLTANAVGRPAGAPVSTAPARAPQAPQVVEMVTACPWDAASSGLLPGMLLLSLLKNCLLDEQKTQYVSF